MIWFLIGMMVGGTLGALGMALVIAGSNADGKD